MWRAALWNAGANHVLNFNYCIQKKGQKSNKILFSGFIFRQVPTYSDSYTIV
jgi:hypothetical protein